MTKTHWLIKIETEWARPKPLNRVYIQYDDGHNSGYATTTANEAVMLLAGSMMVGDHTGWNAGDENEYDRRVHDGDPDGGIKFTVTEFYEDGSSHTLQHGTW